MNSQSAAMTNPLARRAGAVCLELIRRGCRVGCADLDGTPRRRRVIQIEIDPPPPGLFEAGMLARDPLQITYATRFMGAQVIWCVPRGNGCARWGTTACWERGVSRPDCSRCPEREMRP